MQPQRQTVTDHLADVIHIIHIGGKSGTLMVERGEGITIEEGHITFMEGRVIEANVGPQSGLAAFNYLNTWQMCRFSLVSHNATEVSSVYPARLLPSTYRSKTLDSAPIVPYPATLMSKNNEPYQLRDRAGARSTIPFRLKLGEEMLQYPEKMQLSRTHRRLLLLIDGQRGTDDLARLMTRSFDEVQELLNDLVRAGLIRQ
jgi:hypothetical protein